MIVRKTYRYPMRHSLGPRMGFGALVVLTACATTPPFVSRKQPDGSYELTCKLPLSQCLDNVDQVCGGAPYDVVSGHDHRRAIDIRVGTYQNEVRSSDAVVRCVHAKPLFGGDTTPAEGAAAAAPPPEKPHVCVPGITQACVGPAACAGGQACLPDGSGFGPCTCAAPAGSPDGGVDGAGVSNR
jgi:hypothetical protein